MQFWVTEYDIPLQQQRVGRFMRVGRQRLGRSVCLENRQYIQFWVTACDIPLQQQRIRRSVRVGRQHSGRSVCFGGKQYIYSSVLQNVAFHCSDNVLKGLSVLGDWLVVLGENDQNETEAGEQFFSVEEIFVVPEYNCGYNESETKRGPERSCRINTKGCQLAPEGCHTRTKIKT